MYDGAQWLPAFTKVQRVNVPHSELCTGMMVVLASPDPDWSDDRER